MGEPRLSRIWVLFAPLYNTFPTKSSSLSSLSALLFSIAVFLGVLVSSLHSRLLIDVSDSTTTTLKSHSCIGNSTAGSSGLSLGICISYILTSSSIAKSRGISKPSTSLCIYVLLRIIIIYYFLRWKKTSERLDEVNLRRWLFEQPFN